jgi:transcriptional regulator with XRE-family HTH domain
MFRRPFFISPHSLQSDSPARLPFYAGAVRFDTLERNPTKSCDVKHAPRDNLLRLLRRRLGLTQREIAYLIGYDSESHVSRIENGSRMPRVSDLLVIEMLTGVTGSTIFVKVRRRELRRVRSRLERLCVAVRESASSDPRQSYKSARLDRVLESLRTLEREDADGNTPWSHAILSSDTDPPER